MPLYFYNILHCWTINYVPLAKNIPACASMRLSLKYLSYFSYFIFGIKYLPFSKIYKLLLFKFYAVHWSFLISLFYLYIIYYFISINSIKLISSVIILLIGSATRWVNIARSELIDSTIRLATLVECVLSAQSLRGILKSVRYPWY